MPKHFKQNFEDPF